MTKLIFDIGAHNGVDSKIYLRKGYRVIAIEPNPFWALKLKSLEYENDFLLEECALSYDNQVTLFIPEEESASCWATTSKRTANKLDKYGQVLKNITVQGKTLDDLIAAHGLPYYMKCDIEGGDVMFVKMLSESKLTPDYVSFEIPPTYEEMTVCIDRLMKCGYNRFWLSDQRPHTEKLGSMNSGPFGQEVSSDKYTDRDTFLRQARQVIFRNKILGDFSLADKMKIRRAIRLLETIPVVGKYFYTSWHDCHASKI